VHTGPAPSVTKTGQIVGWPREFQGKGRRAHRSATGHATNPATDERSMGGSFATFRSRLRCIGGGERNWYFPAAAEFRSAIRA
jgi:hypothetical protein